MKIIKSLGAISLTGLLLLFSFMSCTYGSQGIFYSIEKSSEVTDKNGINEYVTTNSMAEMGGYYYASNGASMHYRALTESNWHTRKVGSYQRVTDVGRIVSGGVVAYSSGTTETSTTKSDLFALAGDSDDNNYLFQSPDGSTWTQVTIPEGSAMRLLTVLGSDLKTVVALVVTTSSNLFYVIDSSNKLNGPYYLTQSGSYNTFSYNTNTKFTSGSSLTLIKSAASTNSTVSAQSAAIELYLVNANYMWHVTGSLGSTLAVNLIGKTQDFNEGDFSSVAYQAGLGGLSSGLLIGTEGDSDREGAIYLITDTNLATYISSETRIASGVDTNISSENSYPFIPTTFYALTSDIILVGSTGAGLLEIKGANDVTDSGDWSIISDTSYNSTTPALYKAGFPCFFWGSANFFLGTYGKGLWTMDTSDGDFTRE